MSRLICPSVLESEPLESRLLFAEFTVTTAADSGAGSLRQAILDANLTPAADVIRFNIGGAGTVKTILPTSALPRLAAPLTIDGISQPGYAAPVVELSGVRVTTGDTRNGLVVMPAAAGTVIRGLAVNQWQGTGIDVRAGNCLIEQNYIGTDATGMIDRGNGRGVSLSGSFVAAGHDCRIAGNIISGNGVGISFDGPAAMNNVVIANRIGVNAAGTGALGNDGAGILMVEGPQQNRIGGSVVEEANVIAGNGGSGIVLSGPRHRVTNNLIGVRFSPPSPPAPMPNGGHGIEMRFGASSCIIADNSIANNALAGVYVDTGARNQIIRNSIRSNGLLGIKLGPVEPLPNDPLDTDAGPNGLQNFPVLTRAVVAGPGVVVAGSLDSAPSTRYRIDLYASTPAQADPSGFGEGARHVGTLDASTDAAGHVDFNIALAAIPVGDVITATASRYVEFDLETSEFSRGLAVSASTGPFVRQVYVRSSRWTGAFLNYLQDQGLGSFQYGYAIPGGAAQLAVLPWSDIDRISVQFSEPLRILTSQVSVRGSRFSNYTINAGTFDNTSRTASWNLSVPITADRAVLHLEGDEPSGIFGSGRLLDGEWTNGADAYPSGNGAEGGDFDFQINVVAGDVTRSGSVLADDYSEVKRKFFSSTTAPGTGAAAYSVFHDVNGSGSILADDFSEVKRRFFASLPAPVAPVRRDLLDS